MSIARVTWNVSEEICRIFPAIRANMTTRRIIMGESLGWPARRGAADAWRSLGKKRVLFYGRISPSMTMLGIGGSLPIRVRAKARAGGNPRRESLVTKG